MEFRFYSMRFHNFCRRMYFRRMLDGVASPAWIGVREEEIFSLMGEEQ